MPTLRDNAPLPYTRSIAHEFGWQWQIPLQHRMGNGLVYSDAFCEPQHALETLLSNLPGELAGDPNALSFTAGTRRHMWMGNCVAIGLSSGFLEPLESSSIHLVQEAIMKLVELFPEHIATKHTSNEQKRRLFNHYMLDRMNTVRDFLVLHYHVTQRTDSPFWRYCTSMNIPDSLREQLALWKENGALKDREKGLFLFPSWLAVLLGQGAFLEQADIRPHDLEQKPLLQALQNMKQ